MPKLDATRVAALKGLGGGVIARIKGLSDLGAPFVVEGLEPSTTPAIMATSEPSFTQPLAGSRIDSGYTAGSYVSTAGTISSVAPTYWINGSSVSGSTIVSEGDAVAMSLLVTDSAGNTMTRNLGPITIPIAAPVASGALADRFYAQGVGDQTVATAGDFTGSGLTYALISPPAGITINVSSGVVVISTGSIMAEASVIVRATNSAGFADSGFSVTVSATQTAPTFTFSPNTINETAYVGTTVGTFS